MKLISDKKFERLEKHIHKYMSIGYKGSQKKPALPRKEALDILSSLEPVTVDETTDCSDCSYLDTCEEGSKHVFGEGSPLDEPIDCPLPVLIRKKEK